MAEHPITAHEHTPAARPLEKLTPNDSEYTLSILGLVLSVAGQPVVGLVLSIIALKQSRAAHRNNLYALLGMIFGIVFCAITALIVIGYIIMMIATRVLYEFS